MPLINRAVAQEYLASGRPFKDAINRGVGVTTAAILDAISRAILSPGKDHIIKDQVKDMDGMRRLRNEAGKIVSQLGLMEVTVSIETVYQDSCSGRQVVINSKFSERI